MCLSSKTAFTHSTNEFPCPRTHAPTHKGTSTPRQQHSPYIATPKKQICMSQPNQATCKQKQQSVVGTQTPFASSSAIASTFNPLFKLLFMFPSRYLFTIGFTLISSLGWNHTTNCAFQFQETWLVKHSPYTKWSHNSDRHVTFLEICFHYIYMCTSAGRVSEENNSRSSTLISTLSISLFIRHYLRISIWFQFLHLRICLKSAGYSAWYHVCAHH